jgi:hypothetical protein
MFFMLRFEVDGYHTLPHLPRQILRKPMGFFKRQSVISETRDDISQSGVNFGSTHQLHKRTHLSTSFLARFWRE